MADIDELLLARRQKDLDGYVELYHTRLEKMTGEHFKDLRLFWNRVYMKLVGQLRDLYDEASRKEPTELGALLYRIKRLEAYQNRVAEDLKLTGLQLQPYYTGILKHQYEDSYYFAAFGLEQSAKLAVEVPLLTPSHVLGVLANPWVGDAATYAQRSNVNMAQFATGVRESVEEAITQGWGWDKTAEMIREKTDTGFFSSTRLARTELTRAAGQGASYSYMQNADILDGKRWNAVLDRKTAPKDAKNDGNMYDLDYDTVENPGVPGQRIPNHPHCRCIWVPVLSSLGVSTRERIAKDKDGKRTYTKARTYEEYAKEKGLPDLNERLAKDNPKKYLRPGETVEQLSKEVKRWQPTDGGRPITVSKPTWETLKE